MATLVIPSKQTKFKLHQEVSAAKAKKTAMIFRELLKFLNSTASILALKVISNIFLLLFLCIKMSTIEYVLLSNLGNKHSCIIKSARSVFVILNKESHWL